MICRVQRNTSQVRLPAQRPRPHRGPLRRLPRLVRQILLHRLPRLHPPIPLRPLPRLHRPILLHRLPRLHPPILLRRRLPLGRTSRNSRPRRSRRYPLTQWVRQRLRPMKIPSRQKQRLDTARHSNTLVRMGERGQVPGRRSFKTHSKMFFRLIY